MQELKIYNSLSGQKELFEPIHDGRVGMYVCGPTVYNDVHLGNVRSFISFDVVYRFFNYLGYKVRYVRNITDVGHLQDSGEDKISSRAKLERIEPMEIVQKYTIRFHDMMRIFNLLPPNIEPQATGHILEQIEMVRSILDNGLAYESEGSVYFDIQEYLKRYPNYGHLSGRKIDELLAVTRDDLKGHSDKRHPADFAIWMKAAPEHIMRWKTEWSEGFPGWHLECSVMSTKYLGETFDIHGGGNDLKFPHHENEIAQNTAACGVAPAKYWVHTNMLLMNGKKMSKSEGNTISPEELFTGNSPHISKAYSPMVIRFFMLQSHYRSTMDISDDALQAAEKGFNRLMEALKVVDTLKHTSPVKEGALDSTLRPLIEAPMKEMLDDFNTPKALAALFELVTKVNALSAGKLPLGQVSDPILQSIKDTLKTFTFDIFGLKDDRAAGGNTEAIDGLVQLLIGIRADARKDKNWALSDKVRDALLELGIQLKDGPDGTTWSFAS